MRKFLFCFALALPAAAQTGYTIVHGEHTGGDAHLISNATITFSPVTAAGQPMSFKAGGLGGIVTSLPVSTIVMGGKFSVVLADTSMSSPANPCYKVQIVDSNKAQLVASGYSCIQPTGATWSLDTYNASLPATALASTADVVGVSSTSVTSALASLPGCSDATKVYSPTAGACIAVAGTISAAQINALGVIANSTTGTAAHATLADSSTALSHTPITCSGTASIGILANGDTAGCTTTSAVTPAAITTALNATTDSTGTAVTFHGPLAGKITNGTNTASGFQTNGTNGLANSITACMASPGVPCSVLLDAAYQAGTPASSNEHDSFWDVGGYNRSSRRYPANTTVNDERGTGLVFGSNYGIYNSSGSNLYATGAFRHFSYLYDQNTVELTGSAYQPQNQFVSVWDGVFKARGQDTYGRESISKGEEHNYVFATPGISQGRSVNIHCTKARNDCGADYTQMSIYSGIGNGDDEFNVGRSTEMRTGPVNSNIIPTAQVTGISGNAMTTALYNGNVNRDWGIHRLVVRQQCGGVDCAIASVPVVSQGAPVQSSSAGYFGNGQYATVTIDPTSAGIIPSTCVGQATGLIPVPLSNDVQQAVTFTINLMPGTSCSTSGQIYVLGTRRNQTVNYTAAAQTGPVTVNGHSVMQQVITAQMRVDPDAGSAQSTFFPWVFQGGTVGSGAVAELAGFSDGQLSHTKQVVPIAGAIDAHTLVHASHYVTPGLGQYPSFGMMVIPPQPVSVSRTAGVAYITGVSQPQYIYNAVGNITCPTDTSYNATSVTATLDATGLHYPSSTGTSATSVACSWQVHPGSNQLKLYNGNEIVNLTPPSLATGGDLGSYIETEPHTWVASVGDVLESDPESSMIIQMEKSNLYLDLPVQLLTHQHNYGGMRSGGYVDEDVNSNALSMYTGFGGFIAPQVKWHGQGIWGGIATVDTPAAGGIMIQGGCASGGCGDVQSAFLLEKWPTNGSSFYRSLDQYHNQAVIAGLFSGEQFSMQGPATGQTPHFGMSLPLYMQNNPLKQVATGTDAADAVNLGQMQSAIATAVPVIPVSTHGLASDVNGKPAAQTYLDLRAQNLLDPDITYTEYGPGTSGKAAPTPLPGDEATVWNGTTIARERSDGTMSPLCDDSGLGSAKCPTVAQIQAVQTNVTTEVANRQTAITAVAATIPVIPVSANGLASDSKGIPYSQNYLNLQAENNVDPRITYQEYGPGTDGNAAPTPALGNEGTVWNNGQVSRIRHDRSMSAFCDNSGEGCGPTSIQVALPTAAIAANSCSTSSTAAMVGMLPTSVIFYSFASDPTSVSGWGAVGGLAFRTWPTADTLNWSVCNQTTAAITPGSISVNVGAK